MKPDFKRAIAVEKEISKYNIEKTEEKIGMYKHIIQTFVSLKSYSQLEEIFIELVKKYDIYYETYGDKNKRFIQVQYYPIKG